MCSNKSFKMICPLLIFTVFSIILVQGWNWSEKPLLLTPFLKSGDIFKAREHALVKWKQNLTAPELVKDLAIPSYSGFFTVDKGCHSKIFFWFFPATYDAGSAPLILWHGGGPGGSGLSALFSQHGPYGLDHNGSLQLRALPWTLTRSVIYVDSPVGTGFSDHDDRPECYVRSSTTAGKHMLEALYQFYQLFPEFLKNELFIFSGSYGGKFVPSIAYEIHNSNKRNLAASSHINLAGFCIASGFTDPISQIDYADAYHASGLIDATEADYFRQREALGKANINQGNWSAAFDIIEPLVIGTKKDISRLRSATGIHFPYNMAKNWEAEPSFLIRHVSFLNRPDVRASLHVGDVGVGKGKTFRNSNGVIYDNFREDMYQSVKPLVEELLDSGLYRILIISNQLDLIVPHSTVASFLSSLSWRQGSEFRQSRARRWLTPSRSWEEGQQVTLGYVREGGNLTYLFLRNSGHLWVLDQPKVAFQVMTMFTQGKSLVVGEGASA